MKIKSTFWLIVLISGILPMSFSNAKDSDSEDKSPAPTKEDFQEKLVLTIPTMGGFVIIQKGRFHCGAGENRAIFFGKIGEIIGCAKIAEDQSIEIEWENGESLHILGPKGSRKHEIDDGDPSKGPRNSPSPWDFRDWKIKAEV